MAGVSVNEVARAASVSIATVSRVINQPNLVSPTTRERVLAAMEQLNYQVNSAASSLRRGHSKSIALIVASMSQPWYVKLVRALREEISVKGYDSTIYDVEHSPEKMMTHLRAATFQGASGVIIATGDFIDSPEMVSVIAETAESIPLVVIGQGIRDAAWSTVQFDDVRGAFEATKILLDATKGDVAFLGALPGSYLARERLKGYQLAFAQRDDSRRQAIWDIEKFDYSAGFAVTSARLSRGEHPTAIFCVNDELALGAMRAINDFGFTVPDDIQVMGFGNTDFLDYLVPSLSSVDGSAVAAAQVSVSALWHSLEGRGALPTSVLERRIQLRESTGHKTPTIV